MLYYRKHKQTGVSSPKVKDLGTQQRQIAMAKPSKTFRIFVSSTFSDLKEERNALQERVFPRLRELCMQYGCRFQAIDLRWGVSEEAARDQQTMNICLQELERCQHVTPRPNYVILLGDRYGWRPLPPQIEAGEFEAILAKVSPEDKEHLLYDEQSGYSSGWYRKDDNAVPAEYCLRPREVNSTDNASGDEKRSASDSEAREWKRTEKRLRFIFLHAMDRLGWSKDDPRRIKYEASATHQEIIRGALRVWDAREHVYCFFRRIENLPSDSSASDFSDVDEETGFADEETLAKLISLKKSLRKQLSGNIYEYKSKWIGNTTTLDHLNKFCADAYTSLSRIIIKQASTIQQVDELEAEIEAHESFGKERAKFFMGRTSTLQTIADYLRGADSHPLVTYGEAGSGKTALMARAFEQAQKEHPEARIICRNIGATPSSSDAHSLLESLCRQISRSYGVKESSIPTESGEEAQEFIRHLTLATVRQPLILFIDALDQLHGARLAQSLSWLPAQLPKHVRIVVTCLPDTCLATLRKKLPEKNLIALQPMSLEEGQRLLQLWFEDAGRTLQPRQYGDIMTKFKQCGLPLYLKLAFEEARRWRSFTRKIELSSDIPGIIRDLFKRLSSDTNHGHVLVSRSLGYLVAAKNGLTEDELLDVLSLDNEVLQDFIRRAHHEPPEKRLPVVVWSRLYFDIKPYLTERIVDRVPLIHFYHGRFAETIEQMFLPSETQRQRHKVLAQFFTRQPLWMDKGDMKTANLRKLSELPFQQTLGQMWSELETTLGDLEFVATKCEEHMLFDLVRDFDQAVEARQMPVIARIRQALLLAIPAVSARPALACQTLYNYLKWSEVSDSHLQAESEKTRTRLNKNACWISAEAPLPDSRVSGTRSIPFDADSPVQVLSSDRKAVAVAGQRGHIEIRYSSNGEPIEKRDVRVSGISGIAFPEPSAPLAFIDTNGKIHLEHKPNQLQGRKGEKLLAYHPANYVLAVREDNTLVAWDVNRDTSTVLDNNLPSPLVVLKIDLSSGRILYLAGLKHQVVGIASYLNGVWKAERLSYNDPQVVDADVLADGSLILLACLDRSLRIIDATGKALAQSFYERVPDVVVRGRPDKCTFGFGETSACAFLATRDGYVACWEWEKGTIERLEDYRTISEPIALILFDVIPPGRLFLSTTDSGRVFMRQSRGDIATKHTAAVSSCAITASGKVVSVSVYDHTIRWFDSEGLKPFGDHYHRGAAVVVPRGDTDDVIIGDQQGMVWNQKPLIKPEPNDIFMAFDEEVVSIIDSGEGCAIAAGKSGRVLRVHLFGDAVDRLWHSTGYQTQSKILSAGQNGLFLSFWRNEKEGEFYNSLSLVRDVDKHDMIISQKEPIIDVAASSNGETLCVAGNSVEILQRFGRRWKPRYSRKTPVSHVTFFNQRAMLMVVLAQSPWLEVWSVSEGLPTLAAIYLPSEVTCLYARGLSIIAGCRSGDLISLSLKIPGKPV